MAAKKFIFVELLDDEVVSLLTSLQSTFSSSTRTASLHITLRGPYKSEKITHWIEKFDRDSYLEPILINGVGRFKNADAYVIYLKAHSEFLDRELYKPDFPRSRFGSNPHITVYEGNDSVKADAVQRFLRAESMFFLCKKYRLTTYISKQLGLEFGQRAQVDEEKFRGLIAEGKVKTGVLERAAEIARRFERN